MGDFITGTSFLKKRGVLLKHCLNDTLRTKGVQALRFFTIESAERFGI